MSAANRPARTVELRYELLVADPAGQAERLARELAADPEPLRLAFGRVHAESLGRWRGDYDTQQLADIEAEAGGLLETGYD